MMMILILYLSSSLLSLLSLSKAATVDYQKSSFATVVLVLVRKSKGAVRYGKYSTVQYK